MSNNIAASGATFYKQALDVAVNNITMAGVNGAWEEVLIGSAVGYTQENAPGALSSTGGSVVPSGIQIGQGVKPMAVVSKMTQGSLEKTDNQTHLAIQGSGFFQIDMPDGKVAYTRSGVFTIGKDGYLVNQLGYLVSSGIQVPPHAEYIKINNNGAVYAKVAGQAKLEKIGDIELATFINPDGLRKLSGNLLVETEASGEAIIGTPDQDSFGALIQYHVEGSNIDMMAQLMKIIKYNESFQYCTKAMTYNEKMSDSITNI